MLRKEKRDYVWQDLKRKELTPLKKHQNACYYKGVQ